jgi:uncharacterized protein YjbI with pentapeptide repeats
MLQRSRAAVRPRVLSAEGNGAVLLEDQIQAFLDKQSAGAVQIIAPAGAGKTTALQHVAAILPQDAGVLLLDEPTVPEVLQALLQGPVVFTSQTLIALSGIVYRLAPWGRDDLIEYLLARHKERCTSVVRRLQAQDHLLFRGLPDLWVVVLEQLTQDESIPTARHALYRYLESLLPDTDLLERSRSVCLNALTVTGEKEQQVREQQQKLHQVPGLGRVLRHPAAQVLLAADRVAADLASEADCDFLAVRLPRELVSAAAGILDAPGALDRLHRFLAGPPWSHAMAASLLHATGRGWVPPAGQVPVLEGAYLDGAVWPGVQLPGVHLSAADLSGADLRRADLTGAVLLAAQLSHALLNEAVLREIDAGAANLSGADLSSALAERAQFDAATLESACLEDAVLRGASFQGTDLREAVLVAADLTGARLEAARIGEADFTAACLRGAVLRGLPLRDAAFLGAEFEEADLSGCDLELMDLPGANFRRANLTGALLTGSHMPGASFEGADLREAGLAEVDWEGADLRSADLRGASFHLGSSRSGLIFSPIACEGSRTGFYTDDLEEQYYKPPEEVRKANLCGADLRGARLEGADFYLVDLRQARYDAEQDMYLRRCGAILRSPS